MKFLLVTDLHYSDKPVGENNRYHGESLPKLKYILDEFAGGCEFAVCLGDIADSFEGYKPIEQGLQEIIDLTKEYDLPFYTTFGNHDTALDKRDFIRITGMPDRYYSFETEEYLCLVPDTCMNSKDEPYPKKEILWAECYMDDEQLSWMREKIENSSKPVVVLTHVLLTAGETDEVDHILNNADEVQKILLANEEKIALVCCGHYHWGMSEKIGSIPALTFKALCTGEAVTCAVVEVNGMNITVKGFGDEEDRSYER